MEKKQAEIEQEKLVNVTLKDGSIVEGEILFTFEANGDDFVLYGIDEEVFAAKINEEDNLSQIEEDEWPLVEKVFNEYIETLDDEVLGDE